jgi:hypothetical protein
MKIESTVLKVQYNIFHKEKVLLFYVSSNDFQSISFWLPLALLPPMKHLKRPIGWMILEI